MAETRYFVCKLVPPRATFMQDMSDAEGEALGAHIAYWTQLLEEGKVVLFGPVGDPAGVWGLGVVRAADETEAEKLASEDPSITSGLGFKYECFPMLRTVLSK